MHAGLVGSLWRNQKSNHVKAFGETLITFPMPFLWMLLAGFALRSKPVISRRMYVITTGAFLVTSLSVVGKLALLVLLATVPVWDKNGEVKPVAVVVPTGGIFSDESGQWWASSSSIQRVAAARLVLNDLKVPLIISGGALQDNQPAEAVVVTKQLGVDGANLILETKARNSQETAEALVAVMKDLPTGPVLLITSEIHIARMAAVLRHAGLQVLRAPGKRSVLADLTWTDFLPTAGGLGYSAAASREYWGILWYLLAGHISVTDLF